MRPLFLYGTLLDPRVLTRVTGDRRWARRGQVARVTGWRRVLLRGTPYPTLRRDGTAITQGALLRPDAAALARLATYEGASYRLVPVRVCTRRGAVAARAWVAPRWRAAPQPWVPRGIAPRGRGSAA